MRELFAPLIVSTALDALSRYDIACPFNIIDIFAVNLQSFRGFLECEVTDAVTVPNNEIKTSCASSIYLIVLSMHGSHVQYSMDHLFCLRLWASD